jgi:hypothetical protein
MHMPPNNDAKKPKNPRSLLELPELELELLPIACPIDDPLSSFMLRPSAVTYRSKHKEQHLVFAHVKKPFLIQPSARQPL